MTEIYRTPDGRRAVEAAYRSALEHWPVPGRWRTVPTGQGDTFVLASGPADAPPLVLLHGSGTNAAMWIADVAAWAEHFMVYAVDVIGEPGLSAPSRPPLGSAAYAEWLDEVLSGLGVTQASVVGASLGGWLALDYATRRPERVRRLVLTCPGGIGRGKIGWLFTAMLLRPFGRWGQRRTLASVAGLDAEELAPFLDYLTLIFREFRPRRQRLPIFPDAALRELAMPVLVIVGDRDAMIDSRETVRRVTENVPDATTVLLPGVGHSITGQTARILTFLRA